MWVWDLGSIKTYPGFSGQKGTGSRIPDPDPQHCPQPTWHISSFTYPILASTVVPPPHCAAVSDDLLTAKEKNKKMEEEMEAAFQDIQNM
jgi:hypothetical protein